MNNQENQDWQNDCLDIKSRGEKVLLTGVWADCRFLVGTESHQEEFSAHKLILSMASPVFGKMFYGGMPEKTDPILIPDLTPDAFRGILEYMYADKIKIDSCEKAYDIYNVGKKYFLSHIVKYCVEYLIQNLNSTNACKTYEFAKLFDENILKTKCLQIISSNTKTILNDSNFMELEISSVLEIFILDQLNIESELDLLEALNNYANINHYVIIKKSVPETFEKDDNSNEKQQSDNTIQKRNFIDLKPVIEKIRFLTLNPRQFSEILEKYDLLNESESLAILMNISNPMSKCPMPNGFSTSRISRNYSPITQDVQTENGYTLLNLYDQVENTINARMLDFEINFKVDTNIIIGGIKISSQVNRTSRISSSRSLNNYFDGYDSYDSSDSFQLNYYNECLHVRLLNSQNTQLAYSRIAKKLNYDSIMEILFDRPIQIYGNEMYKIGISFDKIGSYPMHTCYPEISCDNVKFTFSVGSLNEPLKKGLIKTILFQ